MFIKALIAGAALIGSAIAPAHTASTPKYVPPAYYTIGAIRPSSNGHQCLTFGYGLRNWNPVFLLPCVSIKGKPEPLQTWYAYRVAGAGSIFLAADVNLNITKHGRGTTVVTQNLRDTTLRETILTFTAYKNGWLIEILYKGKSLYITCPSHIRIGRSTVATWQKGSDSPKITQEWLIEWKEMDQIKRS